MGRTSASRDHTRTAAQRGYDRVWRFVRDAYLREHPICESAGCNHPAQVVHHLQTVDDAPERRLDAANLKALCRPCHERLHGRQANPQGCDASGWPTDPAHPWRDGGRQKSGISRGRPARPLYAQFLEKSGVKHG